MSKWKYFISADGGKNHKFGCYFFNVFYERDGELYIGPSDWYTSDGKSWVFNQSYSYDIGFTVFRPYKKLTTNSKGAWDILVKANRVDECSYLQGTPIPPCGERLPNFPDGLIPQLPEDNPEKGNSSSCSNTGQFGGGGKPLKDIKLFLYANNVTKGTIKLSKPQVEVGTFATDWRPNPSDYVERNSPAYKEVKGLAIQHNQNANKKYLEIETADGYAYGVDLWGGDAKKLLEQQQAEIEELKKLVQTLETKINV